jgi:hypothetical protein
MGNESAATLCHGAGRLTRQGELEICLACAPRRGVGQLLPTATAPWSATTAGGGGRGLIAADEQVRASAAVLQFDAAKAQSQRRGPLVSGQADSRCQARLGKPGCHGVVRKGPATVVTCWSQAMASTLPSPWSYKASNPGLPP